MTKPCIDAAARKRLAELARHYASGLLTNDSFEDEWHRTSKGKFHDLYHWGLWPFSSDLEVHTLTGRYALNCEGRGHIARMILFLRSGFPYRWPKITGLHFLPVYCLSLLTLGWFGNHWREDRWAEGDQTVWPFFTREEYGEALANPVYLRGGSRCPNDA